MGLIIGLFSGPAGESSEVVGVLSQGNKVISEIESTINGITAAGTLVKSSKNKIIEKTSEVTWFN